MGRFLFVLKSKGGVKVKLFILRYKKLVIFGAIPLLVLGVFFGYRMVNAHTRLDDLPIMNEQMQQLLTESTSAIESPVPPVSPEVDSFKGAASKSNSKVSPMAGPKIKSTGKPLKAAAKTTEASSKAAAEGVAKPGKQAGNPPSESPAIKPTTKSTSVKININKASEDQLMELEGIGASKAEAIVAYRKQIGQFKTLEEMMDVKGIGTAIFEKLKAQIEL